MGAQTHPKLVFLVCSASRCKVKALRHHDGGDFGHINVPLKSRFKE